MRFQGRYLLLIFKKESKVQKNEVLSMLRLKHKDYILSECENDIICLIYKKDKFDLTSLKSFRIRGIVPDGIPFQTTDICVLKSQIQKDNDRVIHGKKFETLFDDNQTMKTSDTLLELSIEIERKRKELDKLHEHVKQCIEKEENLKRSEARDIKTNVLDMGSSASEINSMIEKAWELLKKI
jgi:hypothetical protein